MVEAWLWHHLIVASSNPYAISANGITPTQTGSIGDTLTKVVKVLMELVGFLSVIFIIVGGLQISLASGNPARFKQGRETIIYSAVGIGIAVAGFAIVSYLSSALK